MRQTSIDGRVCFFSFFYSSRPHISFHSRIYCSDECESLDAVSPSISTTSSTHPSPYLHSTANAPIQLSDIPALVSSTLGRSLHPYCGSKQHNRLSVSSSSTSSVGCSTLSDDEEDTAGLHIGHDDEHAIDIGSSKSAGSFGHFPQHLQPPAGLNYTRRPSATNTRSTIPSLHQRASSTSSTSPAALGLPSCPIDDESSDTPSTTSSRPRNRHAHPRPSPSGSSTSHRGREDTDQSDTISPKSKQNRASLPAYFSLLTLSTSAQKAQRAPSSLDTTVSLSLKSSPTTPVVSGSSRTSRASFAAEGTPRVRASRRHDAPLGLRSSSRSASPSSESLQDLVDTIARAKAEYRHSSHASISVQTRARLDSLEKVFEWVSGSPVVTVSAETDDSMPTRGRPMMRRNSSPTQKPDVRGLFADADVGVGQSLQHEEESERRGRRLPGELDEEPRGLDQDVAPGYGNGRSGLRAREERDKVRDRARGRGFW